MFVVAVDAVVVVIAEFGDGFAVNVVVVAAVVVHVVDSVVVVVVNVVVSVEVVVVHVVVSDEVVVAVGDIKGQFCSISDDAGVVVIFDAAVTDAAMVDVM